MGTIPSLLAMDSSVTLMNLMFLVISNLMATLKILLLYTKSILSCRLILTLRSLQLLTSTVLRLLPSRSVPSLATSFPLSSLANSPTQYVVVSQAPS